MIPTFDGTFDGNNCSVRGLNIVNSAENTGLFDMVTGGNSISNVIVYGSVSGTTRVAGVVGYAGANITNCTNYATISGTGNYVAGVYGTYGFGNTSNNQNYGDVTGVDKSVANNQISRILLLGSRVCSVAQVAKQTTDNGSTVAGSCTGDVTAIATSIEDLQLVASRILTNQTTNCHSALDERVLCYLDVAGVVAIFVYRTISVGCIVADTTDEAVYRNGCINQDITIIGHIVTIVAVRSSDNSTNVERTGSLIC